jgi:hypothetical protein
LDWQDIVSIILVTYITVVAIITAFVAWRAWSHFGQKGKIGTKWCVGLILSAFAWGGFQSLIETTVFLTEEQTHIITNLGLLMKSIGITLLGLAMYDFCRMTRDVFIKWKRH